MKFTYLVCCSMLAVAKMYQSGVAIKEIARQAGRSQSTIRRWIKETVGLRNKDTRR